MIPIAINGLGRIGRNFLRSVLLDTSKSNKLHVKAINLGPARKELIAHLFKYDTIMGTYPGEVKLSGDHLVVDDHAISLFNIMDPCEVPWGDHAIDWVVEATGKFTHREDASKCLEGGAKRVLITAPAKQEDITIVPGVNDSAFDASKHKIVSLGSCTTNAIVPIVQVLKEACGIERGYMTTVHAYTNSQVLIDVNDSDPRRSRAAALNIIPTTTGATKVIGKIFPELDGKISGHALRVPVANGSIVDFSFVAGTSVTADKINAAFDKAAQGALNNVVQVTHEPLVSADIIGNSHSVVIDAELTRGNGTLGKVFGWYDNEWAYSCRLKDFLNRG